MAIIRTAKNGPSCRDKVTRIDQSSERRNFDERFRTKNLTLSVTDLFRPPACLERDGFQTDECKEFSELIDRRGGIGRRRVFEGESPERQPSLERFALIDRLFTHLDELKATVLRFFAVSSDSRRWWPED